MTLLLLLPLIGWAETTPTSKADLSPASANNFLEASYTGLDGKPYEPMTDAQVQAWLKTISPTELFNTIRKLDLIEHTQPIIGFPQAVIGTTKNGNIFLSWTDPALLTIDVAGQLSYSMGLDAKEFKGIVKKDSPLKIIAVILLSAVTATLAEYVFEQVGVSKTNGAAAVLVSIGLGGAVGGLAYGIWPQE